MDMDILEMEDFRLFDDLAMLDDGSSMLLEYEDSAGKCFPGDDPAPKLVIDQAGKEVLDDLLRLSQDDPLDLDWMEVADLGQFLPGMGADQVGTPATQQVVEATEEIVVIKDTHMSNSVLHDLLTQPITIKQSPPVRVGSNLVESHRQSQVVNQKEAGSVSIQSVIASSSSDEIEVSAEISFDSGYGDSSFNASSTSAPDLLDVGSVDSLISSPLSAEEIDSLLSGSEPSSPGSPCSDSNDPDYTPYQSDDDFKSKKSETGGKQKAKKRRSGPYNTTTDRKDRKRDQNKNAAIRYRNKKREEAELLKHEEDKLAEKNKELNDKVSQLTREINYMKDLISEVCKAKGLKVTFKNKT